MPAPRFAIIRRSGRDGERRRRGPTHENPDFELTWVEHGGLDFALGQQVVPGDTGTLVLLPPGLENTPLGRGGTCHQILLAPALVAEAADALGPAGVVPDTAFVRGAGERLTTLVTVAAKEAEAGLAANDPGLAAIVDAIAFALVRRQPPSARLRRPDRRIRRALERMTTDFAGPLGIDDLAAEAGLSRFAFLRTFRAQVGASPYRHLLSLRLEQAAARLRDSDDSVLAIALACGFGDPGRFARMFRARFGCLPRQYRAAAR